MILKVGTGDKNVIQINKNEGESLENVVHEALEHLGGVAETKRHLEEFIESEGSDYCCFWDIFRMERNLVITFNKIQFGENSGIMEIGGEIMEIRRWVAVRNSGHVEQAVITAWTPRTIRFGYHV